MSFGAFFYAFLVSWGQLVMAYWYWIPVVAFLLWLPRLLRKASEFLKGV